jgi:hypothetical protein
MGCGTRCSILFSILRMASHTHMVVNITTIAGRQGGGLDTADIQLHCQLPTAPHISALSGGARISKGGRFSDGRPYRVFRPPDRDASGDDHCRQEAVQARFEVKFLVLAWCNCRRDADFFLPKKWTAKQAHCGFVQILVTTLMVTLSANKNGEGEPLSIPDDVNGVLKS